jgi:hypothetical protein
MELTAVAQPVAEPRVVELHRPQRPNDAHDRLRRIPEAAK